MLDAEKFLCLGFVHAAGGFGDHFLFGLGEWASFCAVTFDGGIVAVGRDERGQCFNEMPGGTVEPRFVAGVHVLTGPRPQRSPLEVSSHSMTPFAPRNIDTPPSRPCEAKGMNTPLHFLSAAATSGLRTTCGKCGEPISSSPSATKTRLMGSFLPAPRMA